MTSMMSSLEEMAERARQTDISVGSVEVTDSGCRVVLRVDLTTGRRGHQSTRGSTLEGAIRYAVWGAVWHAAWAQGGDGHADRVYEMIRPWREQTVARVLAEARELVRLQQIRDS